MIAASLLDWALERLPLVIFILVFVAQVMRGIWRSRQSRGAEHTAKPDELEAQRRAQEIQEAIRRKRAERVGPPAAASRERELEHPAAPPLRPSPEATQLPDPLGGSLRRVLQELQREMTPPPAPPPLPAAVEHHRAAELERQRKLAEEMRTLAEARAHAERRAAQLASENAAAAQTEPALLSAARGRLLDDLRGPDSLRRAFLLREVLGPPIGLR